MVERLLNKRYAALYPSTFVTYRKDTDESPSKVWQITKDASISAIAAHEYHLRHAGTSTIWAVASSWGCMGGRLNTCAYRLRRLRS